VGLRILCFKKIINQSKRRSSPTSKPKFCPIDERKKRKKMHISFALVVLASCLVSLTTAVTLQTFAPCEDLSPHCPVLCASCIEAETWPAASHESYEIDYSSEEDDEKHKPKQPLAFKKNKTAKQNIDSKRSKRLAGGWINLPDEKPHFLPSWVPWWYKPKPRPSHGGGVRPPPIPPHEDNHGNNQPDSHEIPYQNPKDDKCNTLMNGGRQLVEAFCPRSCGRCGKSSNPLAAAKVYIGAQCTVAKYVIDGHDQAQAPVGLAQE